MQAGWLRQLLTHSRILGTGTGEAWRPLADRVVVGDLGAGVVAADAGARVHTLLADAGGQLVALHIGPSTFAAVGHLFEQQN